jgi:hypothetical protein
MPRLLGFIATKSMLDSYKLTQKEKQITHTDRIIDVTHNGPILETKVLDDGPKDIQSIEIPTYTKPIKLSEMPSEIKKYSNIKRTVNLNPLSDE